MSKKAYPCIGGPLDGMFATTDDFHEGHNVAFADQPWYSEGGMYGHLNKEYYDFNNGGRSKTTMIWVHKDLIPLPVKPRNR